MDAYGLVEVVSHRVCQCPNSVVEDEQVLVLVLPKGKHQRVQDEAQVRHQLGTRLLLQGGERAIGRDEMGERGRQDERDECGRGWLEAAPARCFLYPLVAI